MLVPKEPSIILLATLVQSTQIVHRHHQLRLALHLRTMKNRAAISEECTKEWIGRDYLITTNYGDYDWEANPNSLPEGPEFQPDKMRYMRWQWEVGKKSKTWHYHAFIRFIQKQRISAVKKMFPRSDIRGIKPSDEDRERVMQYVHKEETRVPGLGPYEEGKLVQQGERSDFAKAAKDALTLNRHQMILKYPYLIRQGLAELQNAARAEDRRQRCIDQMPVGPMTEWQSGILDIVKGPVDLRKVYWYWEPTGNVGKSYMCEYLHHYYNAFVLTGSAKMADISYAYDGQPVVVWDLPRTMTEITSVYTILEVLKNGSMFSGKYQSEGKYFPKPHVFVFANFPPDTSYLSADRWDIRNLTVTSTEAVDPPLTRGAQDGEEPPKKMLRLENGKFVIPNTPPA